ncbi:hypothetical protein ACNKHO_13745 [Shigella flexneri]
MMLHYIWWSLPLTLAVFFAARCKLGLHRFIFPLLQPAAGVDGGDTFPS